MADGFLFSAGTDTTIIAYEAVKYNPKIPCLTLAFKHGNPKDTEYVKKMVTLLKLNHETHVFDRDEVLSNAPKVVAALKKFDPMEIRNSMPVYIGLTLMKKKGVKSVFTGDALDELFGYPWQLHLSETEFKQKQEEMWAEMGFSSIPMAESLGMKINAPYMDPLFMDWAKKLPIKFKINMHEGVKYGKWILRMAYEDVVPKEVIWRAKAPLEQGTGTEVAIADGLTIQWVDFPFSSSVSLAAGTYWIGLLCDTDADGLLTPLDSVAGTVYYEGDTYSDGAMATRGAGTTYDTNRASIYATYTPTATGFGHTSLIQFGIC
jgi:asparagine synthetase B (glutamine-hydrolysing)